MYDLRALLVSAHRWSDLYMGGSSNPGLASGTDVCLLALRDGLVDRYPLAQPEPVIVYRDREVIREVQVTKEVQVIKEVEKPLASNEVKIVDGQVATVPVLNLLGLSLGTSAKLSVTAGKLIGIKLV